MFRASRSLLAALPFEPMALTTLDALEAKLASHPPPSTSGKGPLTPLHAPSATLATRLHLQDSYQWFDCAHSGAPFFVSPKHDGIRMISYTPPQAPTGALPGRRTGGRETRAPSPHAQVDLPEQAVTTTTYSRHGRALYGMFWIEKELRLLRALSTDPSLILDGELYIHHPTRVAPSAKRRQAHRKAKAAAVSRGGDAPSTPAGDDFKTGFLAVSALCHRLRGTKSPCATVNDILQYAATLPHYCVFDVASFNPLDGAGADQRSLHHVAYPRPVAAELRRVWADALAAVGVVNGEALRCTPNITPFSQRLRTLHFLMELLSRGTASPVLQAAFGVRQADEVAATAAASGVLPSHYKGGVFVKMVPYEVTRSLNDAKARLLPLYERGGYEGAVIRAPTNTYAMREKRKGVVRGLVASLAALPVALPESLVGPKQATHIQRATGQAIFALPRGTRSRGRRPQAVLLRAYGKDAAHDGAEDQRGDGFAEDNSAAIAAAAVERARHLPRRSETAVKLLPFKDKEYPVLRPLLKEPSTNPRTRPLLTVPISVVCPDGDRSRIKPDPASTARKPKTKAQARAAAVKRGGTGGDVAVFYGLQCLAENGKVFNVTMPKLTPAQQRELLFHLLPANTRSGAKSGKASRRGGGKSLTGTYVTVKFSTLTEHGVPRFGQVKAIRGGKGWHM